MPQQIPFVRLGVAARCNDRSHPRKPGERRANEKGIGFGVYGAITQFYKLGSGKTALVDAF